MRRIWPHALRWLLLGTSAGGLVFVSGCLALAERGLDILLSPAAAGNINIAPYTAVAGLLGVLVAIRPG